MVVRNKTSFTSGMITLPGALAFSWTFSNASFKLLETWTYSLVCHKSSHTAQTRPWLVSGKTAGGKYVHETQHLVNPLYLKLGVFEELWDGGLQGISVRQNLHCCHFSLIPQHVFCTLGCFKNRVECCLPYPFDYHRNKWIVHLCIAQHLKPKPM